MNRVLAPIGARHTIVPTPMGRITRNSGGLVDKTVTEFHAIRGRLGTLAATGGF